MGGWSALRRRQTSGGAYIVLPVCAIRVFCVQSGLLTFWVLDKTHNLGYSGGVRLRWRSGLAGSIRPERSDPSRFVLAMPESLPAVPVVACWSAKCQTEQDSSSHFVASYVIPAQAGIHRTWVPACAGTTRFVSFVSTGGPQTFDPSEREISKKHKIVGTNPRSC